MPPSPFAGSDAALFGRRQRRPRGPRLPVIVVTGFLGAGKTTLIRALLDRPEGANTAIVVNEFGEIGIDQALLRTSSDATVLLGQGCLCCEVRSDLQETLRALFIERGRGTVPSFERVIVETSGLADPGPVLQTFATDRALGGEFHLQALVTVVDAPGGAGNLAHRPEAKKQVALADRIVVTKADLADQARTAALIAEIKTLSAAPVGFAENGAIDPGFVLDDPLERPEPPVVAPRGHDHAHEHTHDLVTFPLILAEPWPWRAFEQAMAMLTALRGPDLLRVKGLLAIRECRGPVVVHYVQHVGHPPVELVDWPDEDRRSRLVFITRALPREPVERLFAAIGAIA
jgi:G3E family GTPase